MIVLSTNNVLTQHIKTPAVFLLAFLLFVLPTMSYGQLVCDNDGIPVQWKDENSGVVELKDVDVKDMTGDGDDDLDFDLPSPGLQPVNYMASALTVNTLDVSDFPDHGIGTAQIIREKNNAWKAEYPENMYDFADENDLILEFEVTVAGGQASHIIVGPSSSASLSIQDLGIDVDFHGGDPKSLKKLEGDLEFRYFDLMQVTAAGMHRADISLCVNVRGNI